MFVHNIVRQEQPDIHARLFLSLFDAPLVVADTNQEQLSILHMD
jgi:hypothetical protein